MAQLGYGNLRPSCMFFETPRGGACEHGLRRESSPGQSATGSAASCARRVSAQAAAWAYVDGHWDERSPRRSVRPPPSTAPTTTADAMAYSIRGGGFAWRAATPPEPTRTRVPSSPGEPLGCSGAGGPSYTVAALIAAARRSTVSRTVIALADELAREIGPVDRRGALLALSDT